MDARADYRRPALWLVPVLVAVIQVAGSTGMRHHRGPELPPLTWFGFVLLLAGPLVLLARYRYPYAVLLAVTAITATYLLAGFGPGPVFLSLVVAFVRAATVCPRWWTYPLPLIGWVAAGWVLPWLAGHPRPPLEAIGGLGAWLVVLIAIAEGLRQRRSVVEARRLRQDAMASAARSEQQREATAARLAIARELHDVLAHSLSMINVQSSVALELLDKQPERAGPALAAIKDASRQAISDVHSLVTALRAEGGEPTAPTPGIADLDGLLAPARATGLTVTTTVTGLPRPLPAVIDVAAARIVQESLTNVVRHSTATTAAVAVDYSGSRLAVAVDDNGAPRTGLSTGGSGITGMRERAKALGGSFSAGRAPGGGFSVRASLPVDESSYAG
ncbi:MULTISPECIES: sensor histidine kinase [unclassified Mycolicibacterium]|uniref:sensor histidine kinase n=1 Tax=unclassified Mycolicibacterium TaxID=2636767 RepID=UPI002EDA21B7